MKHVTFSSIEKAIQKVDHLNDEELEVLSENFAPHLRSIKMKNWKGCLFITSV